MTTSVKQPKIVPQNATAVSKLRPFYCSRAIFASLVFLLVNLVFGYLYTNVYKPSQKPETTAQKETYHLSQMTQTLKSIKDPPKMVLLGSSVMAMPFFLLDEKEYPQNHVDYFERKFDVKSLDDRLFAGKDGSVFNMGTDAAMVSDCYLFTRKFLVAKNKPEWIILGLAPRDFSDTGPVKPSESSQFQEVSQLADLPWTYEFLPEAEDKLSYVISRLSFFYGQRGAVQTKVSDGFSKLVSRLVKTETQAASIAPVAATESFSETDPEKKWEASRKEYKRHYRDLVPSRVQRSFGFLNSLLSLCNQEHVHILAINMPLSQDNRALLPKGFYADFRRQLKETTNVARTPYLDCSEDSAFSRSDFSDTAHLNDKGASKLTELIRKATTNITAAK